MWICHIFWIYIQWIYNFLVTHIICVTKKIYIHTYCLQVVTLAVYSYFGAALIGAQWISPENDSAYKSAYDLPLGNQKAKLDLYYPFFLVVQFAFFFGWLKVAETLINPFGEDDDDFELNRLIDRHTQVAKSFHTDACIARPVVKPILSVKSSA